MNAYELADAIEDWSSSSYWDDKREGLAELKFARAILRKARD